MQFPVNGEAVGTATAPTLKQSKVNTAYSELLEAEKRLVAPTTTVSFSYLLILLVRQALLRQLLRLQMVMPL